MDRRRGGDRYRYGRRRRRFALISAKDVSIGESYARFRGMARTGQRLSYQVVSSKNRVEEQHQRVYRLLIIRYYDREDVIVHNESLYTVYRN